MDSTLVINYTHTYCKNLLAIETKYYTHALRGDRLVGKDHRSSPTATHKEDNQKINHAPTSSHNGAPYVHASGITKFNTSISTNSQLLTIITLISPSLYLKTNARNQTSPFIQCSYMKVFIISLLDAHHIRTKFIT
jgi:hypothetical protein